MSWSEERQFLVIYLMDDITKTSHLSLGGSEGARYLGDSLNPRIELYPGL